MPEPLRALVALLLIGFVAWRLASPLHAEQLPGAQARRRGMWFAMTVAAFVLGNFWLFSVVAAAVLVWSHGRERNPAALFLALLFVVPPVQHAIPGFGIVNFLFALSLPRLLALALLLPLAFHLLSRGRVASVGWAFAADLLVAGYLLIQLVLLAREATATAALRGGFYLFVDVLLPYYVFSRAFTALGALRDAAGALVTSGALLAAVGLFESARSWLLYAGLVQAWGSPEQLIYLERGGVLRAMASTGHSIALGLVLAVCLLLFLPMRSRMRPGWRRTALSLLLAVGLVAPLSRGPWLGAAAGFAVYLALGERPVKNLLLLAASGLAALATLALLPFGRAVLDMLPFIGTIDPASLEYRQRLLESASVLVWRHPLLGSADYVEQLAQMGMTQGQGIVDIVNTYLQVALQSGFAGLATFAGALACALFAALRGRKLARRAGERETADLGRSLAAAQVALIATIASVSGIFVIPWMIWCLAAMLVGYGRLVELSVRRAREAGAPLRFA